MSSSKKGKAPKRSESNPNLNSARAEETVAGPSVFTIDGAEEDEALRFSRSLTREEVLRRRSRRLKQLALCYRRQYWALMEEVRVKHRDYYWEYGVVITCISPIVTKGKSNIRLPHLIMMYALEQRYENGEPIICAKPILVAAVPSLCHIHLQKYHRAISQAFRKTGINMPSGRLVPKISVIVAVSVSHIQAKRREVLKNSSKDTMDQKDEEIQKDMYRSDQDIYD
ncbi:hypothetical protein ZIOFF_005569 [Zingiber officinale]|uniref:Uncharacterized protein n=1 Tax=Zingiber officinale TaxID=94328 RepID=A0A8J5LRR5_ZINOF|nr:hypothetical protein ZIOFF_005569 [Zingiber officinale]